MSGMSGIHSLKKVTVSWSNRFLNYYLNTFLAQPLIQEDQTLPIITAPYPADKSVPWPLSCHPNGLPILPSVNNRLLSETKQIVRSFLSLTYRQSIISPTSILGYFSPLLSCLGHAANNNKASIPWSLLQEDPNKFFDAEYLPAGVLLGEISKMKSGALQSCLKHWHRRQENGDCPFRFKHVHDTDYRAVQARGKSRDASDEEIHLPDFPSSPQYVVSVFTLASSHLFVVTLFLLCQSNPRPSLRASPRLSNLNCEILIMHPLSPL